MEAVSANGRAEADLILLAGFQTRRNAVDEHAATAEGSGVAVGGGAQQAHPVRPRVAHVLTRQAVAAELEDGVGRHHVTEAQVGRHAAPHVAGRDAVLQHVAGLAAAGGPHRTARRDVLHGLDGIELDRTVDRHLHRIAGNRFGGRASVGVGHHGLVHDLAVGLGERVVHAHTERDDRFLVERAGRGVHPQHLVGAGPRTQAANAERLRERVGGPGEVDFSALVHGAGRAVDAGAVRHVGHALRQRVGEGHATGRQLARVTHDDGEFQHVARLHHRRAHVAAHLLGALGDLDTRGVVGVVTAREVGRADVAAAHRGQGDVGQVEGGEFARRVRGIDRTRQGGEAVVLHGLRGAGQVAQVLGLEGARVHEPQADVAPGLCAEQVELAVGGGEEITVVVKPGAAVARRRQLAQRLNTTIRREAPEVAAHVHRVADAAAGHRHADDAAFHPTEGAELRPAGRRRVVAPQGSGASAVGVGRHVEGLPVGRHRQRRRSQGGAIASPHRRQRRHPRPDCVGPGVNHVDGAAIARPRAGNHQAVQGGALGGHRHVGVGGGGGDRRGGLGALVGGVGRARHAGGRVGDGVGVAAAAHRRAVDDIAHRRAAHLDGNGQGQRLGGDHGLRGGAGHDLPAGGATPVRRRREAGADRRDAAGQQVAHRDGTLRVEVGVVADRQRVLGAALSDRPGAVAAFRQRQRGVARQKGVEGADVDAVFVVDRVGVDKARRQSNLGRVRELRVHRRDLGAVGDAEFAVGTQFGNGEVGQARAGRCRTLGVALDHRAAPGQPLQARLGHVGQRGAADGHRAVVDDLKRVTHSVAHIELADAGVTAVAEVNVLEHREVRVGRCARFSQGRQAAQRRGQHQQGPEQRAALALAWPGKIRPRDFWSREVLTHLVSLRRGGRGGQNRRGHSVGRRIRDAGFGGSQLPETALPLQVEVDRGGLPSLRRGGFGLRDRGSGLGQGGLRRGGAVLRQRLGLRGQTSAPVLRIIEHQVEAHIGPLAGVEVGVDAAEAQRVVPQRDPGAGQGAHAALDAEAVRLVPGGGLKQGASGETQAQAVGDVIGAAGRNLIGRALGLLEQHAARDAAAQGVAGHVVFEVRFPDDFGFLRGQGAVLVAQVSQALPLAGPQRRTQGDVGAGIGGLRPPHVGRVGAQGQAVVERVARSALEGHAEAVLLVGHVAAEGGDQLLVFVAHARARVPAVVVARQIEQVACVEAQRNLLAQRQGGIHPEAGAVAPATGAGQVVVDRHVGHAEARVQADGAAAAFAPAHFVAGGQGHVLGHRRGGGQGGGRGQFAADGLGMFDLDHVAALAVTGASHQTDAALVTEAGPHAQPHAEGLEVVGGTDIGVAAVAVAFGLPVGVDVLAVVARHPHTQTLGELVLGTGVGGDDVLDLVESLVAGVLVTHAGAGFEALGLDVGSAVDQQAAAVGRQQVGAADAVGVAGAHTHTGHAVELHGGGAQGQAIVHQARTGLHAPGDLALGHRVVEAVAHAHHLRVALHIGQAHGLLEVDDAAGIVHGVLAQALERGDALGPRAGVHRNQFDHFAVGQQSGFPQAQDAGAVGRELGAHLVLGQRGHEARNLRVGAGKAAERRRVDAKVEHVHRQRRLAVLHVEIGVLVTESHRVDALEGNVVGAGIAVVGVTLQRVGGGGQSGLTVLRELDLAVLVRLGVQGAGARHVQLAFTDGGFQIPGGPHLARHAATAKQRSGADRADAHAGLARNRLKAAADRRVAHQHLHVEPGGGVERLHFQHALAVLEVDLVAAHQRLRVAALGFERGLHRHRGAVGDSGSVEQLDLDLDGGHAVGHELQRGQFGADRRARQVDLDLLPTVGNDVLAGLEQLPEILAAQRALAGVGDFLAQRRGVHRHAVDRRHGLVVHRALHRHGHAVAVAVDSAVQGQPDGAGVFLALRRAADLAQAAEVVEVAVTDQHFQVVLGVFADQGGAGEGAQRSFVRHLVGQHAARRTRSGPVQFAAGTGFGVGHTLAVQGAAARHVHRVLRRLVRDDDLGGRLGRVEGNAHRAFALHRHDGLGGGRRGRGDAERTCHRLLAVAGAAQGGLKVALACRFTPDAGAVAQGLFFTWGEFAAEGRGVQSFQTLAGVVGELVGRGHGAGVFQGQRDRHGVARLGGGEVGAAQLDLGGRRQHAHAEVLGLVPGQQGRGDLALSSRARLRFGLEDQLAGVVRVHLGGDRGFAGSGKAPGQLDLHRRGQRLALELGGGAGGEFHHVAHAHLGLVGAEAQGHVGADLHLDGLGLFLLDRDRRLVHRDLGPLDGGSGDGVLLRGQGKRTRRPLHFVALLPDLHGGLGGQRFVRQHQFGHQLQLAGGVGVDDRDRGTGELEAHRVGVLERVLGLAQEHGVVALGFRHLNVVPLELAADLDRVDVALRVTQLGLKFLGTVAVVQLDGQGTARVVDVERRHPVVAANRDVEVIGLHRRADRVQAEGEGVFAVALGADLEGIGSGGQVLVDEGLPVLRSGAVVELLDDLAAGVGQDEGAGHRLFGLGGRVVLVAEVIGAAVVLGVELRSVHVELHARGDAHDQFQVLVPDGPHQLVADRGQGQGGGDFLRGRRAQQRRRQGGNGAFHSQYLQLAVGSVTAALESPCQRKR